MTVNIFAAQSTPSDLADRGRAMIGGRAATVAPDVAAAARRYVERNVAEGLADVLAMLGLGE